MYLSIYLSTYLSIYLSIHLSIYLSIYLSIIDNTFIYPNVIYFLFMEFYLLKMPSNALCYWKWLFLKFSWSWKEMRYFCYLWWKKVIYYVQHLKWFSFCRKAVLNFMDFREKTIFENFGFICCFVRRNVIIIFNE